MRSKPSSLTKILSFISIRPRSEAEVRTRLHRYLAENIEEVITSLKQNQLINDSRFASWYLESRLHSHPRALNLIASELRRLGISDEIITSLFHDRPQQEDEALTNLAQKKSRTLSRLKLIPYLQRQGFPYSKIISKLDEMGISG